MTEREQPQPKWARLPRWAYWVVGAAVAFVGAITAKVVADQFSLNQRLPFWIAGTAIIFLGLWILSFGNKSRIDAESKNARR